MDQNPAVPATAIRPPSAALRAADPFFAAMVDSFNSMARNFNDVHALYKGSLQREQQLQAEVESLRAMLLAKRSAA